MEISTIQGMKSTVVSFTGLPRDALHAYAGLTVLISSAVVWRKSLGSIAPRLLVLLPALIVERIDMGHDIPTLGRWRWAASFKDILNTLFWPAILLLCFRFCESARHPQRYSQRDP